jgi:hypothetical protein
MAQGEKARGVVASGFSGSPSFIAVVQSTDLRHRHDIPHLRRLNRWGTSEGCLAFGWLRTDE